MQVDRFLGRRRRDRAPSTRRCCRWSRRAPESARARRGRCPIRRSARPTRSDALRSCVDRSWYSANDALPLHEAETVRTVQRERSDQEPLRIDQRTPDPFAALGLDRETVGIVHFGSVVLRVRALVRAVKVHAGQRRDAELADFVAQINARRDFDDRFDAGYEHETIGTGRARRIEQSVERQRIGAGPAASRARTRRSAGIPRRKRAPYRSQAHGRICRRAAPCRVRGNSSRQGRRARRPCTSAGSARSER